MLPGILIGPNYPYYTPLQAGQRNILLLMSLRPGDRPMGQVLAPRALRMLQAEDLPVILQAAHARSWEADRRGWSC